MYIGTVAEKKKPTYDLGAFKQAFSNVAALRVTSAAYGTAFAVGFGRTEIVATIQSMKQGHFFKSMTSYSDDCEWQDVYHVPSSISPLYVKFRSDALTEFALLSFKEKEP